MKKLKNKTAVTTIALILMLTIAVTLVALPLANAHYPPWTIPTFAFITVSPGTVGVGQPVLIIMWLDKTNPTTLNYQWGQFWHGYKVEITRPDGTTETLGPFTGDATGSYFTQYTPAQVGTYKFVFSFPGQTITYDNLWPGFNWTSPLYGPLYPVQIGRDPNYINDTFTGSTSAPFYLEVQQEPVQGYVEAPLPAGYWTRPISAMNRNWASISGNWLAGAAQSKEAFGNVAASFAYGRGPESAHVLWRRPYYFGGLVGGTAGVNDEYPLTPTRIDSANLAPPIIMGGRLYYNDNLFPPFDGFYCVDLYTGETIWFRNVTTTSTFKTGTELGVQSGSVSTTGFPAFGSILWYSHPDESNNYGYLWVTSTGVSGQWDVLDAWTGLRAYSIGNITTSGGTMFYGSSGDIDYYYIRNLGNSTHPKYYLQMWNSTLATSNYQQSVWFPRNPRSMGGEVYNGNFGWQLNASIPAVQGSVKYIAEGKYVIGGLPGFNYPGSVNNTLGNLWALSLEKGQEGRLLWNITFTPPAMAQDESYYQSTGSRNPGIAGYYGVGAGGSFQTNSFFVSPNDDVFVFAEPMTQRRWGYSLKTGQRLWESKPESPWQYYSMYTTIYDGKLFSSGYGGQIIAYNITTGQVLWNHNATAVAFESPYGWGRQPLMPPLCCDGKLYTYSSEHSPTYPLQRDKYLRCINATDGTLIWKIRYHGGSYSTTGLAISDGYLIGLNSYDFSIYCIGIGPSATTVTASPKVSTHGSSVVIEGTVTDQSPGVKGTPAISDDDMQAWMEYQYMQQPCPTNAKGVEVSLDTIDPNGNWIHIGTATSDISGLFSYMWTPEVPGKYTVIATFAGSKSYGSSYAETAIGVSEASPATPPPQYPVPIDTTLTIIAAAIAIIIAVAIATILILRKRP